MPQPHHLRLQHLESHHRGHGGRHQAGRSVRGAALLQSGPADAAGGGGAHRNHQPGSLDRAFAFAKILGKEAVSAKDNSGFIVNLLLFPYLLDAIRALEHGVANTVDIDNAMKLGCGYPMGPLTLLDFVGNDTTYKIAEIMFAEYREQRYAPPPLLKRMVLAGLYGRKSGKGFYDYSQNPPVPVDLGV